jgi:hypothetical protein
VLIADHHRSFFFLLNQLLPPRSRSSCQLRQLLGCTVMMLKETTLPTTAL